MKIGEPRSLQIRYAFLDGNSRQLQKLLYDDQSEIIQKLALINIKSLMLDD
jgi:hypothetical protein